MTEYTCYEDGSDDSEPRAAPTAAEAAERYFADLILRGDALADREMAVVVEHERGPEVDPSATWRQDEDGVFAMFKCMVRSVVVTAEEEQ